MPRNETLAANEEERAHLKETKKSNKDTIFLAKEKSEWSKREKSEKHKQY